MPNESLLRGPASGWIAHIYIYVELWFPSTFSNLKTDTVVHTKKVQVPRMYAANSDVPPSPLPPSLRANGYLVHCVITL